MSGLSILSIASEIFPLVKTGGLADVTGSLPRALAPHGYKVRTLVPGYPTVCAAMKVADTVFAYEDMFSGPARLLAGRVGGLDLFVLDAPHLYARPGGPYQRPDGADWPDSALRFAALGRVGADLAQGLLWSFAPDLVQCHDWQAGLTLAYLAYSGRTWPPTVMSVHNLAFQGCFPASLLGPLGLPELAFTIDGIEYHGQISYLKAGLQLADRITTVSPTYASEICSDEAGMGFQGLLRGRMSVLHGILNGIDTQVWDPERDPMIAARYNAADLASRSANKAALQARLGLREDPRVPLFGVVARFSWQKGLDLVRRALPTMAQAGAQLAVVGAGDESLEAGFRTAALDHPGRVGALFRYDEEFAHIMQAGADAILVPSRFEPCGLTQLCALRYGAVPVAARVGGLADTIIDANPMALAAGTGTGITFSPVNETMLESAIWRAVGLYRDPPVWRQMQLAGMATDVSWSAPARQYALLFDDLIAAARQALRA